MSLAYAVFALLGLSSAAQEAPKPVEGDFAIKDFRFQSGEMLPELKLHYRTLGTPVKDPQGKVRNAVLLLHGTTGSGAQFFIPTFTDILYKPGQPLDPAKYYLIFPDSIGHGASSKPSHGLRMKFPRYTYDDMVAAQHRLLTEGLGVTHLRLVLGTSMGGMHAWVWGETHPDFMDALLPLASLPVEIAGRNRMLRRMVIDSIKGDPEWKQGDYVKQPMRGLVAATHMMLVMTSCPLAQQRQAPTREEADKLFDLLMAAYLKDRDANDTIYQFDASRDYNPAPKLDLIRAPLLAINSADDPINPPELGILEREIRRVKRGRFVLLPIGERTRGHGTHSIPELWQDHLVALLKESQP